MEMSCNMWPIHFKESDHQMIAPTGFATLTVPPCWAVGCQDKDVFKGPQELTWHLWAWFSTSPIASSDSATGSRYQWPLVCTVGQSTGDSTQWVLMSAFMWVDGWEQWQQRWEWVKMYIYSDINEQSFLHNQRPQHSTTKIRTIKLSHSLLLLFIGFSSKLGLRWDQQR